MSDTQQMQPNMPLAVTLSAQQWNIVLEKLSEPMRIYGPLVQAIQQQCMAAQAPEPEFVRRPPRGNGAGSLHPADLDR